MSVITFWYSPTDQTVRSDASEATPTGSTLPDVPVATSVPGRSPHVSPSCSRRIGPVPRACVRSHLAQPISLALEPEVLALQKPRYRDQHAPSSGLVRLPYVAMETFDWACTYLRRVFGVGKVILLWVVVVVICWITLVGQPMRLVEGVFQGLHCGWSSQVEDVWNCK